MPTTAKLGLPYPAPSDTPDVPYWQQQLAEAVDELLDRPAVKIKASTVAQSIPNNTATVIDFAGGSVVHDLGTVAAQADVANDRLVIQEAGLYVFTAFAVFATSTTGRRGLLVQRVTGSGDQFPAFDYSTPFNNTYPMNVVSDEVPCAVGDTFNVMAFQDSGAALSLTNNFNGRSATLAARMVRRS